jgi:molybdate transport system substrate-binding protein
MAGYLGRGLRRLVQTLCGLSLWLTITPATAQDLLVFGAASLQDAFDAVIEAYQAQGGGEVSASYASSSTLARQIEHGAPADIFISANPEWMDYLEERGLIREGSRTDLLGNGLVLVAPPDSGITVEIAPGFDLLSALDGGLLAMGDPVLSARLTRRAVAVLRLAPGQPVFALVKTIALDRVVRAGSEPA